MLNKIINTISGIFCGGVIIFILLLMINQLQQSPFGQNEQANKTLEETKNSISLLDTWDSIGSDIKFIIFIVGIMAGAGVIIYFYKKNDYPLY